MPKAILIASCFLLVVTVVQLFMTRFDHKKNVKNIQQMIKDTTSPYRIKILSECMELENDTFTFINKILVSFAIICVILIIPSALDMAHLI